MICFLIIFFSCKEKPSVPPEWGPEPPLGKGEIRVKDTLWVDRNAVNNQMHRVRVELHLPKEYKNLLVRWSYIDPDDPADDVLNVDPNGPQGDDNGYLGTGEDSLPAFPQNFLIDMDLKQILL